METIGEIFLNNLYSARKVRLGLTQAEAAERIGISLRYYQQLEKGESWPSPDVLASISKAFRCKPWELLAEKTMVAENPKPPSHPTIDPDQLEAIKAAAREGASSLSPEEQDLISHFRQRGPLWRSLALAAASGRLEYLDDLETNLRLLRKENPQAIPILKKIAMALSLIEEKKSSKSPISG